MRGGWYYDVDPSSGTPSRVIVCENTCQKFRTDGLGLDLRYGCETRRIEYPDTGDAAAEGALRSSTLARWASPRAVITG